MSPEVLQIFQWLLLTLIGILTWIAKGKIQELREVKIAFYTYKDYVRDNYIDAKIWKEWKEEHRLQVTKMETDLKDQITELSKKIDAIPVQLLALLKELK